MGSFGSRLLKNLLAVAAALVFTALAVTVLSAATKTTPDAAEQYSRQVRQVEVQVEEFSAPAHTHEETSFLEAAGGFVLILGVSAAGAMLLLRAMQKGRMGHTGQGYQPRRDMAKTHTVHTAVRTARPAPRRVRRV